MTPLFLTSIELEQFRGFAKLDIQVAAAPGVLIVHGSNGIGKSSLFDAMEWTLTDGIDHFRPATGYDKVGTYLCRWRDETGPTSAAMGFSDGSRIERRIASPQATRSNLAGTVSDVVSFLRAPEWAQPISALNRYLLLTHFLGQSTISRLTHRSADERFEILKEAAQSAELEAIGVALHGKGTNVAARAFTRRIADFDRGATDIRDLLTQEADLWEAARISGAIDDVGALVMAQQIAELAQRAKSIGENDVPQAVRVDGIDTETLQEALDAVAADARRRGLTITRSRLLLDNQQRYSISLAETTAAAAEADREATAAKTVALEAASEATERQKRAGANLATLTGARNVLTQLVALRQMVSRLAETREQQSRLSIELATAEQMVTATDREVERTERRGQMAARLEKEIAVVDREIVSSQQQIDRIGQWIERQSSISELRASLASLEAAHPNIDQVVVGAEGAHAVATEAASLHESLLVQLQHSVGSITAAVSSIAANLPADACDCPVCATHFDSAAVLHERAAIAAERLAPLLVGQQEASRSAVGERDAALVLLNRARGTQAQIRTLRVQLSAAQSQNDQLFERIDLVASPNAEAIARRRMQLGARILALQGTRRRRSRWLNRLAPESASRTALDLAGPTRRRDDARRSWQTLTRQHADLAVAEENVSKEFTTTANSLFPGTPPDRSQIEVAIENAADAVRSAQVEFEEARSLSEEQDARVAATQRAEASARTHAEQLAERISGITESLDAVTSQWPEFGWPEHGPVESDLEAAAQALATSEGAIEEARDLLKRLREGREAWERQQAHRNAFERLRLAVDFAPNSERDQVRVSAERLLRDRELQSQALRASKEIARLASADIANEVEEFNAEYIQPLDALMKRISKAILCDHRVGIDLRVSRRKIEQSASRTDEVPAGIGQIDPLLVHSEGQMAALAVSMLCAASLTYPWARWRALVLDDPLQHNDAIHAAAFADFLGNIIKEKEYQVLLSTHDLAQAEFLQRKFDARHIPCATLSLLGRGREGVEWSFRPPKSASPPAAASA